MNTPSTESTSPNEEKSQLQVNLERLQAKLKGLPANEVKARSRVSQHIKDVEAAIKDSKKTS